MIVTKTESFEGGVDGELLTLDNTVLGYAGGRFEADPAIGNLSGGYDDVLPGGMVSLQNLVPDMTVTLAFAYADAYSEFFPTYEDFLAAVIVAYGSEEAGLAIFQDWYGTASQILSAEVRCYGQAFSPGAAHTFLNLGGISVGCSGLALFYTKQEVAGTTLISLSEEVVLNEWMTIRIEHPTNIAASLAVRQDDGSVIYENSFTDIAVFEGGLAAAYAYMAPTGGLGAKWNVDNFAIQYQSDGLAEDPVTTRRVRFNQARRS